MIQPSLDLRMTEYYRPAVLSPPGAVHMEQSIIQHTLPVTDESISDLDGLNLNITIPEVQGSSDKLMPVFVFIHGGGFNIGCASWPEYDFAKIVKLSAEKGLPAIGVSIKYVICSTCRVRPY